MYKQVALEYAVMEDIFDIMTNDLTVDLFGVTEGTNVTNFTSWYGDPSMQKKLTAAGYGNWYYPSIVIHDANGKRVLMVMVEGRGTTPRPDIKTKIPIMWVSRNDTHHVGKLINSIKKKLNQDGYSIKSTIVENELFRTLSSWVEDIDPEYYKG